MDYDQILPQLFVGSYPRTSDDIARLQTECGITAVLNIQTDEDPRSLNLPWDALQAHCASCGIAFQNAPVRDGDTLELRDKLPGCVRALDELLKSGHTVYLHCTAGMNRSPTVAIAYLWWCRGWSLKDAAAHVARRRDCAPDLEALREAVWDPLDAGADSRPA